MRSLAAMIPGTGKVPRDMFVLGILISAVALLLWNGSYFFGYLSRAEGGFTGELQISSTTLTLNVALILFGWRYYVDLQQEITRRAESEERAAIMASSDGMTGLLNRRGFSEKGDLLTAKAREEGLQLAVISIQINRFKMVNDRHGFDIGDEVLRQIAASLEKLVGPERAVARISGDEFAVVTTLGADSNEEAGRLAQAMLEATTAPLMIGDRLVNVGAFVGIAVADCDVSVRDLLRRADIAQAHGRQGRIGRPIWFDAAMERELLVHNEIEQGIRAGLGHGQFLPYFEPQVDLATGEICGFEVLARWDHPISGIVQPGRFIPVAEEHGLMDALSEEIFRQALTHAADWPSDIQVSINISPSQLADSWIAQKLVRILTETGFPAERLMVEITESSLFSDMEMARTIVHSLKNQGIRLALDDFGTGFSSLAHLRALPFDSIKVDRTFVRTIHECSEAEAIIRAVTTLAEAIKIPVTVEGIENSETHQKVIGLGCSYGQGWYFGKPMSAHQADQLLRSHLITETRKESLSQRASG